MNGAVSLPLLAMFKGKGPKVGKKKLSTPRKRSVSGEAAAAGAATPVQEIVKALGALERVEVASLQLFEASALTGSRRSSAPERRLGAVNFKLSFRPTGEDLAYWLKGSGITKSIAHQRRVYQRESLTANASETYKAGGNRLRLATTTRVHTCTTSG